ncbi:MAG: BamA/TamA family outer membrane protein [Acidobacteriota bacterium]|nr:BamA/TamA family outer membrane protein [Acidobacteriota bacterium]
MLAQQFVGKTITAVRYQPAAQPIDPQDLTRALMIQVGQPLETNQLAATIDRLYRTGLYNDIEVDAEPSPGGVAITFITQPRRFIGHVGAQGDIKDPPSRAVIIGDSQLYLGQPFDEDALNLATKSLEQQLQDNGLYHGKIGVATIEDPVTHQVTIRFVVEAGKRSRYETPVIHGDTKLSDATIIKATGWRWPLIHKWRQVTAVLTDKGVQGIAKKYGKKDRLTASVNLTSLAYDPATGNAKPTFDIDAGPRITVKALEAKVSKRKLKQYVPIYDEGSVDNDLLAEGARNLHDYFQSKGYPDVDVTFKEESVQNDQQVINYYIATGPRRKLVKVDIKGNTYFLDSTLRERMFLQPSSLIMRYGRYSESFRKQDEDAIANLYVSNGFQDVKVTSAVESNYNGKPKDIAVTYNIDEGKQWRVADLKVVGTARLSLAPIRQDFASIEGQPYAEINIATDRNRILEYYYSQGFPSASFSYAKEPGPDPATVNLIYRIREGPREFVRQVILSGLYRTKTSLVERFVNVRQGEPISLTKVNEDARALTGLGMFANVNSALQNPDGSTRYKDVIYDFDEAARYNFSLGLGLIIGQFGGTTQNYTNSAGAKGASPIVSFNVNRINLFGIGQTLSLQTTYSTLEQRESLNYIFPRFLGSANRTVTFSLLYDTTQDVQTFSSRRLEGSVQTSQRFNRASTLLLRFAYRRVSTGSVNIPALLIPQFSQPVRIGILSASYIQDHRDNPADAHSGFWNTIDTGLAGNFFGSQRNFGRVLARNATYTSLGRNLVLARQTQLGAIIPFNVAPGISNFEDIPLPERFYGGGGVSMRGFGDNQAGPRDIGTANELPGPVTTPPTGFPIGGNALFFNNVELRFPLLGPNISGVVFEDMGNIYTTFNNLSFGYTQKNNQSFDYAVQAPGFGIRYKTPLGPVRLDLAYALNPSRYTGFNINESFQQLLQCTPQEIGKIPPCTPGPQRLGHFQFFFSIGQAF